MGEYTQLLRGAAAPLADQLLQAALHAAGPHRRLPEATYRLQLHADFTFRDAAAIVEYLEDLGITHCYASVGPAAAPAGREAGCSVRGGPIRRRGSPAARPAPGRGVESPPSYDT